MVDLCQDTLPKSFNRWCIDCKNLENKKICDWCLQWPRERPGWTPKEKSEKKEKFKRKLSGFEL